MKYLKLVLIAGALFLADTSAQAGTSSLEVNEIKKSLRLQARSLGVNRRQQNYVSKIEAVERSICKIRNSATPYQQRMASECPGNNGSRTCRKLNRKVQAIRLKESKYFVKRTKIMKRIRSENKQFAAEVDNYGTRFRGCYCGRNNEVMARACVLETSRR